MGTDTQDKEALVKKCAMLDETIDELEIEISRTNAMVLEAEMSSMALEQLFQAMTDALWIIREDGVVVKFNRSMLKFLGKTKGDVLGQNCQKLLGVGICAQKLCPLKATIKSDENRMMEFKRKSADGQTEYYLATVASLITVDGSPGIIEQFQNITTRKRAEVRLSKANTKLIKMATIDGLTQIANRRVFDETIQKEWRRLLRDKKPLSLIMSDVDFFKKYNDHYGHRAGDSCLKKVAKAISSCVGRPADLVARYGGEEFAVILSNTERDGATHVAETIRRAVLDVSLPHEASEVNEMVTLSMGVASIIPTRDLEVVDVIENADAALYKSKESGRNRVTTAA